nr:MAG TPA: hypothetical protein [Ackermannviridae sp.]
MLIIFKYLSYFSNFFIMYFSNIPRSYYSLSFKFFY